MTKSDNCFICGNEFLLKNLKKIVVGNVVSKKFNICNNCVSISDPRDDYNEVKNVILKYVRFAEKQK